MRLPAIIESNKAKAFLDELKAKAGVAEKTFLKIEALIFKKKRKTRQNWRVF